MLSAGTREKGDNMEFKQNIKPIGDGASKWVPSFTNKNPIYNNRAFTGREEVERPAPGVFESVKVKGKPESSGGKGIGFQIDSSSKNPNGASNDSSYGSVLLETIQQLDNLSSEEMRRPELQKAVNRMLEETNNLLGSMHTRKF